MQLGLNERKMDNTKLVLFVTAVQIEKDNRPMIVLNNQNRKMDEEKLVSKVKAMKIEEAKNQPEKSVQPEQPQKSEQSVQPEQLELIPVNDDRCGNCQRCKKYNKRMLGRWTPYRLDKFHKSL